MVVPRAEQIPASTQLRVYPVLERHGFVFFFFGPSPLFPLPFFADCDPCNFVASQPFSFATDSPWFMLVGNGFDGQHFQAVHDRKLTTPPKVDCPAEFARRMRFEAEVVGTSVFDCLLKYFVGKVVRVSITSWGGPYVLVEGEFGRAHSRLLVTSQPVDESNTLSQVIVFARKSSSRLFDQLNLRVRRRFTQAFLQYDIDKLQRCTLPAGWVHGAGYGTGSILPMGRNIAPQCLRGVNGLTRFPIPWRLNLVIIVLQTMAAIVIFLSATHAARVVANRFSIATVRDRRQLNLRDDA